jgi:putative inorganic carbon (HCO3(-)) transporter
MNETNRLEAGLVIGSLIIALIGYYLFSFISPVFFSELGGNIAALTLGAIATLLISYLSIRTSGGEFKRFHRWIALSAALLLVSFIVQLIFSYDIYRSLYEALRWLIGIILFFTLANYISANRQLLRVFGYCIVGCAVLLSLVGIRTFIDPLQPTYLRFISIFYEHNTFGSFLLIPLFVSLGLYFSELRKKYSIILGITTAFLAATLILTFSRGTWVSFIVALIVGILIFYSKIPFKTLSQNKNFLLRLISIILGTALIASGLFLITKYRVEKNNVAINVFNNQVIPTSSTKARLYYDLDALKIISHHPFGVGFNNYQIVAQTERARVVPFAFDPHNIYLKAMAELGIVGGIIFLCFILGIPFISLWRLRRQQSPNYLLYALACGIVAVLIHNGIEAGFGFSANLYLFFTACALLYGALQSDTPSEKTSWPLYTAVGLAVVVTLVCLPIYAADNAYQDGEYFKEKDKLDEALPYYDSAEHYFPWNTNIYYGRGEVFYKKALILRGEERKKYFLLSLDQTIKSEQYRRFSSKTTDAQSKIYAELGNVPAALQAAEKTIAYDPLNNLGNHRRLVYMYYQAKRYDDVVRVSTKILQAFPPELFSSYEWGDPYREEWRKELINMSVILIDSYGKLHKQNELLKSAELLQRYKSVATSTPIS